MRLMIIAGVVAPLFAFACTSTERAPRPQRGAGIPLSSGTVQVQASSGGTVSTHFAHVDIPPNALPADLAMKLTLLETLGPYGVVEYREVVVSPPRIVFAHPATLSITITPSEVDSAVDYAAAMAHMAVDVDTVDNNIRIELSATGTVSVTRGTVPRECGTGEIAHGGGCVRTCEQDDDCDSAPSCANGFSASVIKKGHCDSLLGACKLDDEITTAACDSACLEDNGLCAPPGVCPPVQHGWEEPAGICLCGFPELYCQGPVEAENEARPWVGAHCDDSADCDGLGCTGLPTCLRPGALYPEECLESGLLSCFYEAEGFGGPCASLCGARE